MYVITLPIDHKALRWDGRMKRFILTIDKLPYPAMDQIGGLRNSFAIKNEQTKKIGYVRHKCNETWEVTCMGETWTLIEE